MNVLRREEEEEDELADGVGAMSTLAVLRDAVFRCKGAGC